MLEIKDLKKNYNNLKVLKGIDLKVNKGDKIAIIGPSGCGKSTFLRCINMLEIPTSGHIIYNDIDITKKDVDLTKVRQKIGMVFQQFNLFPHLSVIENIELAPLKLNLMIKEELDKKALELLEMIGLKDKKDSYPTELSGGQMQRVAIVRSLIMNPEILLLDEPTSALDPEMINEVLELIKKIGDQGMTMIIVSHEMNFVKNFADKVLFFNEGLVAEAGTVEEIFSNPKNERLKEFLSELNK